VNRALCAALCMASLAASGGAQSSSLQAAPNHIGREDAPVERSQLPSLLESASDRLVEADGSLSWKALARISIVKHENTDNRFGRGIAYFAEAVPAAEVRALVGRRVKVKGYVLPRQAAAAGAVRILVSALPAADADGCTAGGNETFVDAEFVGGNVPKMDTVVMVEGTLALFDMKNWGGYIYKLVDPRIISGA
jgi:hypothetical protein